MRRPLEVPPPAAASAPPAIAPRPTALQPTRTMATASSPAAASSSAADATTRQPTACIVIGMAGAGKTTLMQRLNAHLHDEGDPYYMVNLDPAVLDTPFGPHVDIRDTVNYKEVMKQYQLGPNGGILTSLNLFATRFDQVIGLMEKRNERDSVAQKVQERRQFLGDLSASIEEAKVEIGSKQA